MHNFTFENTKDNPEHFKVFNEQLKLNSLHIAISQNDREKVEQLINEGVDVNAFCVFTSQNALFKAYEQKNFELLEYLIEKGGSLNGFFYPNCGIYEWGLNEYTEYKDIAKKYNVLPFDKLQNTLQGLYATAKSGQTEAFDYIIRTHFNNQITPFVALKIAHQAIKEDEAKPIRFLHQKGVTSHLVHSIVKYKSMLHFACLYSANNVVKAFLEQGINPNILNYKNQTPLHSAAIADRSILAIKYLLDFGANINASDFADRTPVYRAVEFNQKENLEFLIAKGADLTHKDMYGLTVFDDAIREKRIDLAQIIETALNTPRLIQKRVLPSVQNTSSHQR